MGNTKGINLIPEMYKKKRMKNMVFMGAMIALSIIAVCFGVLSLFSYLQKVDEEGLRDKIKDQISLLQDASLTNQDSDVLKATLEQKKLEKEAILPNKMKVMAFLDRLSHYIPENVNVSSLSIDNGKNLSISFASQNTILLARLIVKLKEMAVFEKVEMNSFVIKEGTEKEVTLTLKIK